MVTKRTRQLKAQLLEVPRWDNDKGRRLSDALLDELIENCKPTETEFCEMMAGTWVSAYTMWRLPPAVVRWQENEK